MSRVALATFGSGGDLFPLIPVARRLEEEGHDVILILPRSLSLYTRTLGLNSFPIGDGSEMRVYNDAAIYTSRFSGWASWRTVYNDYVATTLADDIPRVRRFLTDWRPDVVVTSSFAVAARVAALADGHAHRTCSIYPQHLELGAHARNNFPKHCVDELMRVAPNDVLRSSRPIDLVWGSVDSGFLLHDAALLGRARASSRFQAVGFPYWDDAPSNRDELLRALDWIEDVATPTVVVTMGSLVGLRPMAAWGEIAGAVTQLGARALLVGAKNSRTRLPGEPVGNGVLATGFLPLSKVLPHATAVAHHGGIGTMFSAVRSGIPALVAPQAFDQAFSADLVEQAGVGVNAQRRRLSDAVQVVLSDVMRERADRFRSRLVESEIAATTAASFILEPLAAVHP